MTKFQKMTEALVQIKVLTRGDDIENGWKSVAEGFDSKYAGRRIPSSPTVGGSQQPSFEDLLRQKIPEIMEKLADGDILDVEEIEEPELRDLMAADFKEMLIGIIEDQPVNQSVIGPPLSTDPSLQFGTLQNCVDNIYKCSLNKIKINGLSLRTDLPPLVNFSASSWIGPHTKHLDRIRQFFLPPSAGSRRNISTVENLVAGIVGMPKEYAFHPLLWGVLAHEVTGHTVVHALVDRKPGRNKNPDQTILVEELKDKFIPSPNNVPLLWVDIWKKWMEETTADVCALLTMGPAFPLSLAAWISASAAESNPDAPPSKAGDLSSSVGIGDGGIKDEHPPILLRLHVALGVLRYLRSNKVLDADLEPGASIDEGIDIFKSLVKQAPLTIDFVDVYNRALLLSFDRSVIAKSAEYVGEYIATTKLTQLRDKALADIFLYTDKDAAETQAIRKNKGKPAAETLPTANQLLAGATLALWDDPSIYDQITGNLDAALAAL